MSKFFARKRKPELGTAGKPTKSKLLKPSSNIGSKKVKKKDFEDEVVTSDSDLDGGSLPPPEDNEEEAENEEETNQQTKLRLAKAYIEEVKEKVPVLFFQFEYKKEKLFILKLISFGSCHKSG